MPETDDPQVQGLVDLIRSVLPSVDSVKAAADLCKANQTRILGELPTEMLARFDLAENVVTRSLEDVETLRPNSIVNSSPNWYTGPDASSKHWLALETYLSVVKKFPQETVQSIDETSTEIVSLLKNPMGSEFSCRGLVVGYVQSGKTANMTAVIAKAADAGYDLIIVLAGLTDKLRQQTQRRLESDIVARHPDSWMRLTTADLKGDYQTPPQGGLVHNSERVQLIVTKKNVGPLKSLLKTIKGTRKADLRKHRVLIIDDECDQASVNSATKEFDVSSTNSIIRTILGKLPRVSYAGYTATPFANVLINPYADEGPSACKFDDLYPRDFITSLPVPSGYFGTERLFGRHGVSADDDDDDGLDAIRPVPDEDSACLQPARRKDNSNFNAIRPESLEDAILYFLATCAVRRLRGQKDSHMTMLVHTSTYVELHGKVAGLIRSWLAEIGPDLSNPDSETIDRLHRIWKEESAKLSAEFPDLYNPSFEAIVDELPAVMEHLKLAIENGASDDRIEYGHGPRTYIVVGGSVLSRGLTLEGLSVSYFMRTANQYDTLLQMGRWFGFRVGYGDLPRVWMPQDLQTSFRALSSIESEIREDIKRYTDEGISPEQFAVRIRQIPGMAITTASKMRHAMDADISYWGRHVQTIRFDVSNTEALIRRWRSGSMLVDAAQASVGLPERNTRGRVFRGVASNAVIAFLESMENSSSDRINAGAMLSFIKQTSDEMPVWNVGVIEPKAVRNPLADFGAIGNIRLVTRTRLRELEGGEAYIKAIMSLKDVCLDMPSDDIEPEADATWESLKKKRAVAVGRVPLLLLYGIDGASTPKSESGSRVALGADHHVLGYAIIFPGSKSLSGRSVCVQLRPYTPEQLDAMDEEKAGEAEAAGV